MDRKDSHTFSSGEEPSKVDDCAMSSPSTMIKRCIKKRKDQCTQHTLKKRKMVHDDAIDATENASDEKPKIVSRNRMMIACKVCLRVMRSDNLKRHMRLMHASRLISVRKQVPCSVCDKVMRYDHLKRHMDAKHAPLSLSIKPSTMKKCAIRSMKRKRAPKLPEMSSAFDGKSKPEDVKVMFSTACAMKTVTDTLHGAFKDIHDEIASMFETKGIVDASERVTNVLAPVEEKIAMNAQQHICDAADELKRVICSSQIEWINSAE